MAATLDVSPFPDGFEEAITMFDFTCRECGKHRLVFPSQIRGLTNTDHGIEVRFECWCGAEQTWLTGRRAPRRRPSVAA